MIHFDETFWSQNGEISKYIRSPIGRKIVLQSSQLYDFFASWTGVICCVFFFFDVNLVHITY